MAKRTYSAVLEPNGDRREPGFGVTFPDLPGCVSFGVTVEDALVKAEEALSLHLEGMAEDGEPFPDPAPVIELMERMGDDLPPRASWALVTVEAPDAAERVNVYLQKSLLERIDRFAEKEGINRSGFFNQAARRYLEERQPGMILNAQLAAVARSLLTGAAPAVPPAGLSTTPAVEALYAGDIRAAVKAIHDAQAATEGVARSLSISRPKRKLRFDE